MNRKMNERDVFDYDAAMRKRYPDCDTFFVSSAAYDAGISERTLRNYQSIDDTLDFIKCFPDDGGIATYTQSMQAWGQQRRGARKSYLPRYPFSVGFLLSDCSSGSAK